MGEQSQSKVTDLAQIINKLGKTAIGPLLKHQQGMSLKRMLLKRIITP
jgi:hypothetical protein